MKTTRAFGAISTMYILSCQKLNDYRCYPVAPLLPLFKNQVDKIVAEETKVCLR